MKSLFDYTLEDLIIYFEGLGLKKYKAEQVYDWLYKKRVLDIDAWSNISKELKDILKENFNLDMLRIVKTQISNDTNKYLFELEDKQMVEAVLMKYDYGNSICVSSQVGCNMGCSFCESGRLKKVRNLNTSEMVRQIMMIEHKEQIRISSVVVMGIGEPFDNYDNVMNFIKIINSNKGIAIGSRHITVSTCGLVPKIREYAHLNLQTNLAISLHAPYNELRSKIMKINNAYPIEEVMDAVKYYINETGRRVTIEYILLKDVNDTSECAKMLASLLKGLNIYVNLIPYNETSHIEYKRSERINEFYKELINLNINVTVRRELGSNIDAACGQLRANEVER